MFDVRKSTSLFGTTTVTSDKMITQFRKLEMCGGRHVEQLGEATHLVTSGFKRSLKWYAALNVCGWVVTPDWINESFNSKWFLDEEHFQLKDAESENKYSFHIRERYELITRK